VIDVQGVTTSLGTNRIAVTQDDTCRSIIMNSNAMFEDSG
jgi:hypothetical protein